MLNRSTIVPSLLCAVLSQRSFAQEHHTVVSMPAGLGVGHWVAATDMNESGMVCGHASTHEFELAPCMPFLADGYAGTGEMIHPATIQHQFCYAWQITEDGTVYGSRAVPIQGQAGPMSMPGSAGLSSFAGVGPVFTTPSTGSPVPMGGPVLLGQHQLVRWHADGSGGFDVIPGLGPTLGVPNFSTFVNGATNTRVVGTSWDGEGPDGPTARAFLYQNGTMHDLSGIAGPGTFATAALDVNESGQICGIVALDSGGERAFVADINDNVTILPALFNSTEGTEYVNPYRMNDLGQVIGSSSLVILGKPGPTGLPEAEVFTKSFLWDPINGMQDFGDTGLSDINNHGEMTGTRMVQTPEGPRGHAFYRNQAGQWTDLNDLVDPLHCNYRSWIRHAPVINDDGKILLVEQWCLDSVFTITSSYVFIPRQCAGDATYDAQVNVDDLLTIIERWGTQCIVANCPADIAPAGGDRFVNVDDLLAVISGWGGCN